MTQQNKYEGTTDLELAYAAGHEQGTYQVAARFFVHWRHSRRLENVPSNEIIRLRQSMRIYLRADSAEVHSDPIWNDGALSFLKRSS